MGVHREGVLVAKSGKGRVVNRGTGRYVKVFIYVPRDVAVDSAFPFAWGEDVRVSIEGDKLVVEKWRSEYS